MFMVQIFDMALNPRLTNLYSLFTIHQSPITSHICFLTPIRF